MSSLSTPSARDFSSRDRYAAGRPLASSRSGFGGNAGEHGGFNKRQRSPTPDPYGQTAYNKKFGDGDNVPGNGDRGHTWDDDVVDYDAGLEDTAMTGHGGYDDEYDPYDRMGRRVSAAADHPTPSAMELKKLRDNEPARGLDGGDMWRRSKEPHLLRESSSYVPDADAQHVRKRMASGREADDRPVPTITSYGPLPSGAGLPQPPRAIHAAPSPSAMNLLTIRALISRREGGLIIGKAGANIQEIRVKSNARIHIEDAVDGTQERVLQTSGVIDQVARAFFHIARKFTGDILIKKRNEQGEDEGAPPPSEPIFITLNLLVPDSIMGFIIGRGGATVKQLQEQSHARLQGHEGCLPNSNDRILTVTGVPEAIELAVTQLCRLIQMNKDQMQAQAQAHVPYSPIAGLSVLDAGGRFDGRMLMQSRSGGGALPSLPMARYVNPAKIPMPPPLMRKSSYDNDLSSYIQQPAPMSSRQASGGGRVGGADHWSPDMPAPASSGGVSRYGDGPPPRSDRSVPGDRDRRDMYIPNEMIANIIGRGGKSINEIRQRSGALINIDEAVPGSEDRLVSVAGPEAAVQAALRMLNARVEEIRARDTERR